MRNIIFVLFFYISLLNIYSQNSNIVEGVRFYDRFDYDRAIEKFKAVLEKGSKEDKFIAYDYLGKCYKYKGMFRESSEWYKKLMEEDKNNKENILKYGLALKSEYLFDDAMAMFEEYSKKNPNDIRTGNLIKSCLYAKEWVKNKDDMPYSVNYIKSSGQNSINTLFFEYNPFFNKDKLIIASSRNYGDTTDVSQSRYYCNYYDVNIYNMRLTENKELKDDIEYNGSFSIIEDGNKLFFTKIIKEIQAKGKPKISYQIWYKEKKDGKWSESLNILPFNSMNYFCVHPSLSKDGKSLYFASNMSGGYGGFDIYVSKYDENTHKWNMPINLGEVINTPGDELFVMVYDDVMYFSSDFHPGLGGLDIFRSVFENDEWSKPENLKPPINSIFDDFHFVPYNSNYGVFCSDNPVFDGINSPGFGDIFTFYNNKEKEIIIKDNEINIANTYFFDNFNYKVNEDLMLSNNNYYFYIFDYAQKYLIKQFKNDQIINTLLYEIKKINDNNTEINIQTYKDNKTNIKITGYHFLYSKPVFNSDVTLIENGITIETTSTDVNGFYSFKKRLDKDKLYTIVIFDKHTIFAANDSSVREDKNNIDTVISSVVNKGNVVIKVIGNNILSDENNIMANNNISNKTEKISESNDSLYQYLIDIKKNETNNNINKDVEPIEITKENVGYGILIGTVKSGNELLNDVVIEVKDVNNNIKRFKSKHNGNYICDRLYKQKYEVKFIKENYKDTVIYVNIQKDTNKMDIELYKEEITERQLIANGNNKIGLNKLSLSSDSVSQNKIINDKPKSFQNGTDDYEPIDFALLFKPMPKREGVYYMIQVGAFIKPIKKNYMYLQNIMELNKDYEMVYYYGDDSFWHVLIGCFNQYDDALVLLSKIREQGFQSFIAIFENGIRKN